MEVKIETEQSKKINWSSIAIYYLIACSIAWPFLWWRDMESESWARWELPTIVKTWCYMWGPGISVIIVTLIFKNTRNEINRVTLFGDSVLKSLLFWFVPFVLLSIPGIENGWNINNHLFPVLAMGGLGFISIIGEDWGWSGFLKNALITYPTLKRSFIIAVLWEIWHFTNRTAHKTIGHAVISVSVMILILTGLTFIMSKITDRTKSLVTAVTIHMWINVINENGSPAVYIVFGISLIFWTVMLVIWDKPFWNLHLFNRKLNTLN